MKDILNFEEMDKEIPALPMLNTFVPKIVQKILKLKSGTEFHFDEFLPKEIMQDNEKTFKMVAEIKKKLKGKIESKEKGFVGLPQNLTYIRK